MIKNSKGFSLVEALIASAVLITAALGFSQYFSMKSKNIKTLSNKLNSNQHNLVISQLLRDKDICQLMIKGKKFTRTKLSTSSLTDLKIRSVVSTTPLTGGDVLYEAGTKLDAALKIKSIGLDDIEAVSVSSGIYRGMFKIEYDMGTSGSPQVTNMPMAFLGEASGGSVEVSRCLIGQVETGIEQTTYEFEAYDKDLTKWICTTIPSDIVEKACYDMNGCTVRFLLQHESDSHDQVRVYQYTISMEQPDLSSNRFAGIYGWSSGYGGGSSAWILQNDNLLYSIAGPWEWAYLLNYEHSYCHVGDKPRGTNSTAFPDFTLSFMSHPYVKSRIQITD